MGPSMAEDEKRYAGAIGHTRELQPHLRPFADFLEEFKDETERGAALTAAAFLDDLLQAVIEAFLIRNKGGGKSLTDGFNAPLGTLSARIAACHAMGLISDEEYQECELMRKIRNEFAHKMKMSFNVDPVRSMCDAMHYSVPGEKYPRGQFTSSAVVMLVRLTNRAHYVGQKAFGYQDWPI
jgi:mannitol operon repressor